NGADLTLSCRACPPAFSRPVFSFMDTPTTWLDTLSLHDALPISSGGRSFTTVTRVGSPLGRRITGPGNEPLNVHMRVGAPGRIRSEEHTSELQSRVDLVCRLLLEKKKKRRALRQSGPATRQGTRQ